MTIAVKDAGVTFANWSLRSPDTQSLSLLGTFRSCPRFDWCPFIAAPASLSSRQNRGCRRGLPGREGGRSHSECRQDRPGRRWQDFPFLHSIKRFELGQANPVTLLFETGNVRRDKSTSVMYGWRLHFRSGEALQGAAIRAHDPHHAAWLSAAAALCLVPRRRRLPS